MGCAVTALALLIPAANWAVGERDAAPPPADTSPSPTMEAVQILDKIRVGSPEDLVVDPTHGLVYVANGDEGTVSVIDSASRKVVSTIPVGGKLGAPGGRR